ncbi:glucokinase [Dokdonella sp.]|uniref:glucokinase n=1 Tax=Dokdonella sp. TaxID=2291710 RepID=UPI001B04272D|nr:glucokinase [Dokdonella sp.]MBO9662797.1 glucokinase [Dokdonella sp.]
MSGAVPLDPVLLADVGGTNVRFALADPSRAQPLVSDSVRRYRVADYATFTDAALAYLGSSGARARRGVFAFAGQVRDGEVQVTNHSWSVSRERVRSELALESATFINDFAAMSLCLPLLAEGDRHVIGHASPAPLTGTRTYAVIGPGTGLGVGALLLRDGVPAALETEGGHTSFAPRTEEEVEVLRRLTARFGRVSNERLLCGSGLSNLHEALGDLHGIYDGRLTPEEITRRADLGEDAGCVRAVEMFCELLGAVAGDFVLAFGAWDGAWLAGGLTPLLLPWLERGGFRRRFEDKGRFVEAMAQVPSTAILHRDAGLLGAAAFALQQRGTSA